MAKRSKFNTKKFDVDGQQFDSKKEAQRYRDLLDLQSRGLISDLQRQVKFELIPSMRADGHTNTRGRYIPGPVIERAVYYVADFVYTDCTGERVVEDVKGYRGTSSAGYKVFIIKRKLMLQRYGIRVKEI